MFSRFDVLQECDRRTDGHRAAAQSMIYIPSRDNNSCNSVHVGSDSLTHRKSRKYNNLCHAQPSRPMGQYTAL